VDLQTPRDEDSTQVNSQASIQPKLSRTPLSVDHSIISDNFAMPDLPSKPEALKLVPNKARLYPKFQSFKLQQYAEETHLKRFPLPVPPSRPALPNNARVGFQDVRVRTGWNHLSQGWQGQSVLYVGSGGEIVRLQGGQVSMVGKIRLGSRTDVYGYYADVIEVGQGMLVATDGLGQLFVLQNGEIVGSWQEEIPFILFDGRVVDGEPYILICQSLQPPSEPTTAKPLKGEYLIQKLKLQLSPSFSYTATASLTGAEIPKHAILTPDILLVTTSPYRLTSLPLDPEEMDVDTEAVPPPLYTFFQTDTDIDISIPLPLNTPKSAIQIAFSTSTLKLHFLPPKSDDEPDLSETYPFQTAEEKPLWGAVGESTWTLSQSPGGKVLDIHLEKLPGGPTRWLRLFEDEDGAEEYFDPSERRSILERLEKYTQSASSSYDPGDAVRRRFVLEEDEDIDSVDAGDIIQYFRGTQLIESHGHDLLAVPFVSQTLGVKVSIDMCVFDMVAGHVMTVPAFSFVASSKRLRKYSRYTDDFAVIIESGKGGNMYVYYLPQDGEIAKQIVVRLGLDSLGVGFVPGEGVVIIGEGENGFEGIVVGGL